MINQVSHIKQWLKTHANDVADTATFGFRQWGRGAVIVNYTHKHTLPPNYISARQLREIGVNDHNTIRAMANYDPLTEVVVLILFPDGAQPFKLTAHPVMV